MGFRGRYLLTLFLGVILYILLRDGHEMSLGIWATALAVLPCRPQCGLWAAEDGNCDGE